MIAKEITNYRKQGDLQKAKLLADKSMLELKNDIWVKRAYAWVYYELSKQEGNTQEMFVDYIGRITKLNLKEDESILWKNCIIAISSYVFKYVKTDKIDVHFRENICNLLNGIYIKQNDEEMSFLMRAFLRMHKLLPSKDIIDFFFLWYRNAKPLPSDYLASEYKGTKMIANVERVYVAVAKEFVDDAKDEAKLNDFILILNNLCVKKPDYVYTQYYLAKLLLISGQVEKGIKVFMPFAMKKNNEFWVWQMLAEFFLSDKEHALYMLAKAYMCKTKTEFKIKLMEQFAFALVDNMMKEMAAPIIWQCANVRKKHKWKIPPSIDYAINTHWCMARENDKINVNEIMLMADKAEQVFWDNCPSEIAVVAWVDKKTCRAKLVWNIRRSVVVNTRNHNVDICALDFCEIFTDAKKTDHPNRKTKVFKIEKTQKIPSEKIFCHKKGVLSLKHNEKFAFVDNNYVSPKLLGENKFVHGQIVEYTMVYDMNKFKGKYMWNVLVII